MAVSDGSGEVIYRFVYGTYGELYDVKDGNKDSLGNIAASEGYTYAEMAHALGMEYLYNGQYGVSTDMNGLYYMRARYYDQSIKRFINRDVLSGDIGNSQSLNRFSYVQGNPVSLTDPFGLCPDGNGKTKNLASQTSDSVSEILNIITGKPSVSWQDVGKAVLGLFWIGGDLVTSRLKLCVYAVAVVSELDWSAIGHTLLGLAGIVFDAADLVNAAWYFYEKNYEMAAVSMLCALPYVGTLVGGSAGLALKVIGKGFTLGFAAESAFESISRAYEAYKEGTLSWWNALDVGVSTLGFGLAARGFQGTFRDALAGRTEPGILSRMLLNRESTNNVWITHRGTNESISQKLDQGYLPANYPSPNNAFTRFTEHSEKAVWVSEGRPSIFNKNFSGMVGKRGEASITFDVPANIVKKPNGLLKRWFGKSQRVIESDVIIPDNAIVKYGGKY